MVFLCSTPTPPPFFSFSPAMQSTQSRDRHLPRRAKSYAFFAALLEAGLPDGLISDQKS
jgi:hypothetical protein